MTDFYFAVARPAGGHYLFITAAGDVAKSQAEEADIGIRNVALKTVGKGR